MQQDWEATESHEVQKAEAQEAMEHHYFEVLSKLQRASLPQNMNNSPPWKLLSLLGVSSWGQIWTMEPLQLFLFVPKLHQLSKYSSSLICCCHTLFACCFELLHFCQEFQVHKEIELWKDKPIQWLVAFGGFQVK